MREVIHHKREELIAEFRTDLVKGRELINQTDLDGFTRKILGQLRTLIADELLPSLKFEEAISPVFEAQLDNEISNFKLEIGDFENEISMIQEFMARSVLGAGGISQISADMGDSSFVLQQPVSQHTFSFIQKDNQPMNNLSQMAQQKERKGSVMGKNENMFLQKRVSTQEGSSSPHDIAVVSSKGPEIVAQSMGSGQRITGMTFGNTNANGNLSKGTEARVSQSQTNTG